MMHENVLQTYRVPVEHRYPYINFESLGHLLTSIWTDLANDELLYIAIINFNSDDLAELERRGLRRALPKFKALVDNEHQIMIVKFMPGVKHDRISRTFANEFHDNLTRLGIYRQMLPSGSERMSFPSNIEKEPDEQYKPRSRNNVHDYPTFVVEVGVSESLHQLRQDARLWLVNTGGRTKIVLIISLNRSQEVLRFERWQNSPGAVTESTRHTTGATQISPANVQELEYRHNGGLLTGAPLVLPADLLLDSPSPSVPVGEVRIDSQSLLQMCADVFFD